MKFYVSVSMTFADNANNLKLRVKIILVELLVLTLLVYRVGILYLGQKIKKML